MYPSSCGHLASPTLELAANIRHGSHLARIAHDDDEVGTERPDSLGTPKRFPDNSLDPVSHDGRTNSASNRDPQASES